MREADRIHAGNPAHPPAKWIAPAIKVQVLVRTNLKAQRSIFQSAKRRGKGCLKPANNLVRVAILGTPNLAAGDLRMAAVVWRPNRCVAAQDTKQTRQIFLRLVYGNRQAIAEYTYGCG